MNRQEALDLFLQHNKDAALLKHALAVEAAMRYFARKYGESEDLWGIVGLLHDIDWEKTQKSPEEHTSLGMVLLGEAECPPEIVRAMRSHAWGLLQQDVPPESTMEKVLYGVDELTGFVTAVALVRPSKSLQDLEVKSVKKKLKDKAFARGVDRDVIQKGTDLLGVSLEELIEDVILALRPLEREIGLGL
jgi:putative nucleotidyltransferase with HDIG domain